MRNFYAILLLAALSGVAVGQSGKAPNFHTGNEFLSQCRDVMNFAKGDSIEDVGPARGTYCIAFVYAFSLGYSAGLSVSGRRQSEADVCPPQGVNRVQLFRVAWDYTESHPEQANMRIGMLIVRALTEAFPCGRKAE